MKVVQLSLITAVALAALVTLAPGSRAQDDKAPSKSDRPPAGQRQRRTAGNQFDSFAERLKLTEEQKTKLQPIFREQSAKLRELRQDKELKPEELREKNKAIREEFLGKMKPILTTEQYDQLKKAPQRGAARGGQQGARRGGDTTPPPARAEEKKE